MTTFRIHFRNLASEERATEEITAFNESAALVEWAKALHKTFPANDPSENWVVDRIEPLSDFIIDLPPRLDADIDRELTHGALFHRVVIWNLLRYGEWLAPALHCTRVTTDRETRFTSDRIEAMESIFREAGGIELLFSTFDEKAARFSRAGYVFIQFGIGCIAITPSASNESARRTADWTTKLAPMIVSFQRHLAALQRLADQAAHERSQQLGGVIDVTKACAKCGEPAAGHFCYPCSASFNRREP